MYSCKTFSSCKRHLIFKCQLFIISHESFLAFLSLHIKAYFPFLIVHMRSYCIYCSVNCFSQFPGVSDQLPGLQSFHFLGVSCIHSLPSLLQRLHFSHSTPEVHCCRSNSASSPATSACLPASAHYFVQDEDLTELLFRNHWWLPVDCRINCSLLTFLFKAITEGNPPAIHSLIFFTDLCSVRQNFGLLRVPSLCAFVPVLSLYSHPSLQSSLWAQLGSLRF